MKLKMKTLRAKFQIKSNIFVHCYVEVEDVSDTEFRAYIGVKRRADTVLPIGAKVFINPDSLKPKSVVSKKDDEADFKGKSEDEAHEFVFVRVLKHQVYEGSEGTVHICSPIQRENRNNLRKTPRKPSDFKIYHGKDIEFSVENGSTKGLGLFFKSNNAVVAMTPNREYTLTATHKEKEYSFPGSIKHILYNWKTYEHRIGFELQPLSKEKEIVMNILIDPEYKISLSGSTVDAATGKITGG